VIETDLVKLWVVRVPVVMPNVRVFIRTIIDRVVQIDGRTVRLIANEPGQGDAWALVKGGRHIEIEAKAARGTMREAQERWQAFCAAWGVDHLVVRARKNEKPEETIERWCEELRAVVERT
jgi:hypothetical protein